MSRKTDGCWTCDRKPCVCGEFETRRKRSARRAMREAEREAQEYRDLRYWPFVAGDLADGSVGPVDDS